MAHKQAIKRSECRILVYLANVPPYNRYMTMLAVKLDMDYAYLCRIIRGMEADGWISKGDTPIKNKSFWNITELGREKLCLAQNILIRFTSGSNSDSVNRVVGVTIKDDDQDQESGGEPNEHTSD
jgi:DNA-binding MarR family transcriptional regulator